MGVPLTAVDGMLASALAAGVVMDTANFQHPNTTRARWSCAALRRRRATQRDRPPDLPHQGQQQLILFGRVLSRLDPTAMAGSSGPRSSWAIWPPPEPDRTSPRASSTCSPRP